jgi:ribosome-binding factor A
MGRRAQRLTEEIREQVARMIASDLKDPRLGFVTVTRVEMTHDLGLARVHVGVLGSEAEREKTLKALGQASGFVRRELGKRLRIRTRRGRVPLRQGPRRDRPRRAAAG